MFIRGSFEVIGEGERKEDSKGDLVPKIVFLDKSD